MWVVSASHFLPLTNHLTIDAVRPSLMPASSSRVLEIPCAISDSANVPSVFRRNLQCEPVSKSTLERNDIDYTHVSASSGSKCEGTNCIVECESLSKTGTVRPHRIMLSTVVFDVVS
jgi:hypothetical protein